MTYEQKFAALAALRSGFALNEVHQGYWRVFIPEVRRKPNDGGFMSSRVLDGVTKEEAVDDAWSWLTDSCHYVVVDAYGDNRRAVKWNGFMWEDVDEHQ